MNEMKGSKRLVLVVDDDPTARKLVRLYLEPMGLEVVEADREQAAFERIEEQRPDLICLDLMLPTLSGFDVCERIHRTPWLRNIPILIISGRAQPQDRALAEELGADAFVIKPFSASRFTAQVQALLGTNVPIEERKNVPEQRGEP
jgi:DNA-binding response OmpR family regulator